MDRQAWQGGHQEFAAGLESMSQNWEGGATGQTWGSINNLGSIDTTSSDTVPADGSFDNGGFEGGNYFQEAKRGSRKVTVGDNLRAEQAQLELNESTPSAKTKSPLQWDSERVGQWLEELGLPAQAFVDCGVTGEDLFALSKGENSTSGVEAMKKLRPFLARRVVYEADRLMSMILEKSGNENTQQSFASLVREDDRDNVVPLSPINGYVNQRTAAGRDHSLELELEPSHEYGRDKNRNEGGSSKYQPPNVTPIKTQNQLSRKNSGSKSMESGIYEPQQPLEPPPPIHDQDDDSNATISSENSENMDELNDIRESFEYEHDEAASDTGSSTSVRSLASPVGLNMDITSPFYNDEGVTKLESHLKRLNEESNSSHLELSAPAEPKASTHRPRQSKHKSNGHSSSVNSMTVLKPTVSALDITKEVTPKHHKHHHKHHHRNVDTKRYVSFASGKEASDSPVVDIHEAPHHTYDDMEPVDPPPLSVPKKLSLYKMSELINKSFPKKDVKSPHFKPSVSFFKQDEEMVTKTLDSLALDSLDTMDSIGTMDTVGSVDSQASHSKGGVYDDQSESDSPTQLEFDQPIPRERKLSLYKMSEFINSSFGNRDGNDDKSPSRSSPRSRSIKMKKVQSKKLDENDDMVPKEPMFGNDSTLTPSSRITNRNTPQRKSADNAGLSPLPNRSSMQRKSADSEAGLTPLARSHGRIKSSNDSDRSSSKSITPTSTTPTSTVSRHHTRIRSNGSENNKTPPSTTVSRHTDRVRSNGSESNKNPPSTTVSRHTDRIRSNGSENSKTPPSTTVARHTDRIKSNGSENNKTPPSTTVSRSTDRIKSNGNESDSTPLSPFVSPVVVESRKKNRALKFNVEKNDQVEVEKEMKMKAGRKIRTVSPKKASESHIDNSGEVVKEKKKKNRGISRIVLATEETEVAGGNDSTSEGVCLSGGGGRTGDGRLRALGSKDDKKMLQTPKKKTALNGDFDEQGNFTYGEWTIDQDGIQSMPADRTDLSTAPAQHGRPLTGKSTANGYSGGRGHNDNYGIQSMPADRTDLSTAEAHHGRPLSSGLDLFHPSSNLSEPMSSLHAQQQGGHYLAQPSRKPNLSSILSDNLNPLDGRGKLGQLKGMGPRDHLSSLQPHAPPEEVPHHKHHKHGHRHNRHSHDTVSSTSSDDQKGGSMRDSNNTWRSVESFNKIKTDGLLSPNSIDDDMVNQASLNNSLTSRSSHHGFGDSMRSENGNWGESHDDVLMSSLKLDKAAMPVGGAGGDFEAQHKGFRDKGESTPGFRPMNGNLMNGSAPNSGRATTPNTPRRTKINLVKLEELGRGAGGVVYKAVHIPTMTVVAVKHIFVEDDAKRRQMQRELNLLHAFNSKPLQRRHDLGDFAYLGKSHPINLLQDYSQEKKEEEGEGEQEEGFGSHVVSIYDAYSDKSDRSVCLVLEYMSGGSLESFVKEHRRLTEAQIAHIARCCFLALSDLKKRRLLHRDIKPANILIDHLGNVKLSDFGIMKEFEEDSLSKTFTGTLAYMSPERILCGSGQSDEGYSYPADIWGVGLSLLALGLGKEPFPLVRSIWDVLSVTDETKNAVPSLRNKDNFANLTKIDSSNPNDYLYSADLCDMVDCCLRRDANLRLTADELLKHPFFDKYPPSQNTAGLLSSEKTVRIFGSALREQEEKGAADPFEPPPPPLFGMFVTPEAAATRMLVALIKSLNPSTENGLGATVSSNNSARGGKSHAHDKAKKFNGLSLEILKRLRSQLPGIDESRFQQLHDRALKGLEGDERRKGLMNWVNKRTK